MKINKFIATFIIIVFFTTGCEKDVERLDDYFMNFATVIIFDQTLAFQLDNQRLLIPQELKDYTGITGQRTILTYTPLTGDTIKVNDVVDIFTGTLQTRSFPEWFVQDPVKIQSVWVGGNYLNMIFETEYFREPHTIALFRDRDSSTIDLYFSHSRNNDPPGYPQTFYASFLISNLRAGGISDPIPFRLFINTYEGMRELQRVLE